MRSNPFLLTIVLLSLLSAGLTVPAQAAFSDAPVSPPAEHEQAIQAAEGAVYGRWERALEEVAFFVDTFVDERGIAPVPDPYANVAILPSAGIHPYVGDFGLEPPTATLPRHGTTAPVVGERSVYEPHPNDKRMLMHSSDFDTGIEASFILPEELRPTRDYQIYGLEATFYIGCASDATNADAGAPGTVDGQLTINIKTRLLDDEGNFRGYKDYSGSSGQQDFLADSNLPMRAAATPTDAGMGLVYEATIGPLELGTVAFGEGHRGEVFDPETEEIEVRVAYRGGGLKSCYLHFGTQEFPSHFKLLTDTATVNTWIEHNDAFTTGLPAADKSSQTQRSMTAKVAQASAWPTLNAVRGEDPSFQSRIWTPSHHAGISTATNNQWHMRWRNLDDNGVEFSSRVGDSDQLNERIKLLGDPHQPSVTRLADGLDMIEYDYIYTSALPDARYAFEVYSGRGQFSTSTEVAVGLKAFNMDLIDSRGPTATVHEVEAGEETVFLLSMRNLGAQADDVRLSTTSPGTGWKVDLSSDKVRLPAGSNDPNNVGVEVPITVTPSATAKAGDQARFTITARSASPEEVPDQTLEMKVVVVEPKQAAVAAYDIKQEHSVAPGTTIHISDLRVHNLGSRADTYLVEAQLPLDARGWTTRADPPARLIPADSVETFGVDIHVAHDAPHGLTVDVPVTVRLVGDTSGSVLDTILVTVHVILENKLDFSVSQKTIPMRTPVEECLVPRNSNAGEPAETCELDDRSDRSALYRLRFTNNGAVDETYTLKGDWEGGTIEGRSVAGVRSGGCDDDPPDHWRLDYGKTGDNVASNSQSREPRTLEKIAVPAGQTVTRWVEMGYNWPFGANVPVLGCDTPGSISPAAAYRLVATIDSAPGQKVEHVIGAYRMDDGIQNPLLEPDVDPLTSQSTQDQESQLLSATQEFEEVTYRFRVRHAGTEHTSVTVSVPPMADYDQHLVFLQDETPLSTTSCQPRDSAGRTFVCRGLGINGEAVFDLVVKPDADRLDLNSRPPQHSITATATDGTTGSLVFTTKLVGEFQFEADTVVAGHQARPGQEVNLPFQVLNRGSRDDTFSISVAQGDPEWRPRLSTDDRVFVAGAHDLVGYLRVQVPETAEPDDPAEQFQVRIASSDPTKGAEVLTFTVKVVADTGLVVQGVGGNPQVLIEGRGQPQSVQVEALDPSSDVGDPITFRVDRTKLPSGWRVEEPFQTAAVATDVQGHVASAAFVITAPERAIGSSSVPLIVEACRGDQTQCVDNADFTTRGDLILNLQDDVGVSMRLDDPDVVTATLPGGDVVLPVRVQNAGLSPDVIDLSSTEARAGWSISYDPQVLHLAPLESRVVDVIVSTPTDAAPGEKLDFLLFATSRNEASEFAQLQLSAEIGVFDLEWSTKKGSAALAPSEVHSFVARVHNNGTLPDAVFGTAGFGTPAAEDAYKDLVDVRMTPAAFELRPGESRDVIVNVRLAPSVPAGVTIPVQAKLESLPDAPTVVAPTFDVRVLDYRTMDVDGDGIVEFAVDRNQDRGDGYEEFLESDKEAGTVTGPAQLVRFLSDEGRLRHTVKVTADNQTFDKVVLRIDGDAAARGFGDGKVDLLLDSNGDGLPDLYWDPDDGHSGQLTVFKDINADGVPDYFVDTSGNGEFNAVYDLAQGTFLKLLVRDVDNDGQADYVVDKNGNGRADGDETVLFSRDGKLIQVTKVDVDGDGKLDDVFDTDGDGSPDYFVPNGRTKGVPIKVDRDLNKDGFLDWSYDANRDDRDDHYYDPVTQTGGHAIDAQAEFVRSLQQYWYVGALFLLVAALFVVLVAVTRR